MKIKFKAESLTRTRESTSGDMKCLNCNKKIPVPLHENYVQYAAMHMTDKHPDEIGFEFNGFFKEW